MESVGVTVKEKLHSDRVHIELWIVRLSLFVLDFWKKWAFWKIRNHWNDSYLSYDDSVDVSKPKVFSAELTQRYYQEWIILPGSDRITRDSSIAHPEIPGPSWNKGHFFWGHQRPRFQLYILAIDIYPEFRYGIQVSQ